jgi:hypothetical protein
MATQGEALCFHDPAKTSAGGMRDLLNPSSLTVLACSAGLALGLKGMLSSSFRRAGTLRTRAILPQAHLMCSALLSTAADLPPRHPLPPFNAETAKEKVSRPVQARAHRLYLAKIPPEPDYIEPVP